MTEDDGKFEEWMYDFAWKGYNEVLEGIKILDNKAMSIINFSSILIPLIAGVFYYTSDKAYFRNVQLFLIVSIFLLIMTIFLAFIVLMPRNHGIIPLRAHFKRVDEFIESNEKCNEAQVTMGKTAHDIVKWQDLLLQVSKDKSMYLQICGWIFIGALCLVFLSTLGFTIFFMR